MTEVRRYTFVAPADTRSIVVNMHTNLSKDAFMALVEAKQATIMRLDDGTLAAEWVEDGMRMTAFGPRVVEEVKVEDDDPLRLQEATPNTAFGI